MRILEELRPPRASRRRVLENRGRLLPGIYVNPGGTLWHHWRRRVPRHVARSKGWSVRPREIKRALGLLIVRLARLLTVSSYLRVHERDSEDSFTVVVIASDDSVLFLDPEGRRVIRSFGDGALSSREVELRRRWGRHVPSPRFEVVEGGSVLREEFIEGAHIHDLAPDDQLAVVRQVFRSYAALVRDEQHRDGEHYITLVRALRGEGAAGSLPPEVREVIAEPGFAETLIDWPLVPSGSDNSPDNVVVTDGGAVFIDVLPMQLRPFFGHPCAVTASWDTDRGRIRAALLGGGFDAELRTLFEAAGLTFTPDLTFRQLILLLSLPIVDVRLTRSASRRPVARAFADRARWLLSAYGLDDPAAWYPTGGTDA